MPRPYTRLGEAGYGVRRGRGFGNKTLAVFTPATLAQVRAVESLVTLLSVVDSAVTLLATTSNAVVGLATSAESMVTKVSLSEARVTSVSITEWPVS